PAASARRVRGPARARDRAGLDRARLLGLHHQPAPRGDLGLRRRLRALRLPLDHPVPARARGGLDRPALAAPALRRLRRGPGAGGRPRLLRRLRPGRRRARAAGVGPAPGALTMRELAAVGLVALLFGVGAFYADRDVPLFAVANLAVAG